MTTYKNALHSGDGIFYDEKYQGERHAPGYNYLGPGTRLDIRLDEHLRPKKGEEAKDPLDATALKHDIAYKMIQDEYKKTGNKQKALQAVHKADDLFIKEAKNSPVQPLGNISATIIKAKELGEKTGIINTNTFSGLGVKFKTKSGKEVSFTKKPKQHDPTSRLKALAGGAIAKNEKTKKQHGGIAPLAIGVISALAGTALGKIWDLVRDKIEGKGYKIDPKEFTTDSHKRRLLRHILF